VCSLYLQELGLNRRPPAQRLNLLFPPWALLLGVAHRLLVLPWECLLGEAHRRLWRRPKADLRSPASRKAGHPRYRRAVNHPWLLRLAGRLPPLKLVEARHPHPRDRAWVALHHPKCRASLSPRATMART
jgi:hypothetical protein